MLQSSPYPVVWVPPSPPMPMCPPGLENLLPVDFVSIEQQIEILEVFTNLETANMYLVKNRWGHILYYFEEDSQCCCRCFCPSVRPMHVRVTDVTQQEVLFLDHPSSVFLGDMFVEAPRGNRLGEVLQVCDCCVPTFLVNDPNGNLVFRILGPAGHVCCACCRCNVDFKVMSKDGTEQVGLISKKWSGVLGEVFTDADKFGVSFPRDLDVRLKAVLLGACLLIDFTYFEEDNATNRL